MAINPTPFAPKTSKKKMNPLFLMLGVALLLGLGAAFGIWQYLTKTQNQVKELAQTKAVVVAAKEIMAGTPIMVEDLTTQQVPIQTVPEGSVSDLNIFNGRIAKGSINPNEPITETKLVPQGSAAGLPGIIPPGHRAITIKVNDVSGVGGFVAPGNKVDIISIRRGEGKGNDVSKVILQDVLVIAVGDALYDPNMVGEPVAMIVSQITVALDPINSQKLALASSSSQIQLVLRGNGEINPISEDEVTLSDVYENKNNKSTGGSLITVEPKDSIDIILGDQRTTYYYY